MEGEAFRVPLLAVPASRPRSLGVTHCHPLFTGTATSVHYAEHVGNPAGGGPAIEDRGGISAGDLTEREGSIREDPDR